MKTFKKAKTAQLGEVHEWHGTKMVKTANGWEHVDKSKKKKNVQPENKAGKDKFEKTFTR